MTGEPVAAIPAEPHSTQIETIHTLGPEGTNCEAAAIHWFDRHRIRGEVRLYRALEDGLAAMPRTPAHALLGCAVYPELHTLVFSNLSWLRMTDAFVMPTHSMVLASRGGGAFHSVASHPAPKGLAPADASTVMATSNAEAARMCAEAVTDACVTTMVAARRFGLHVVHDFKPVPMVFTVHVPYGETAA